MKINLHKNATTTPAQRAFIQRETKMNISQIALRIGVSETTVRRWKKRSFIFDKPHTPEKRASALTPVQELVVILIRLCLRPGLDDLQQMVQIFISSHCSRSALNRCLKKYEVSRLPPIQRDLPFSLNDYKGTFFYYSQVHIPFLHAARTPLRIQVLLDHSFRWVHADISFSAQHPLHFIKKGIENFPLKTLGIIFSDPIVLSDPDDLELNRHHGRLIQNFCAVHNLKSHHLKTFPDETLGQLRQIYREIRGAKLPSFNTGMELNISGFMEKITLYNTRLCQRTLKKKTPAQALENHFQNFPGSFRSSPKQLIGTLS